MATDWTHIRIDQAVLDQLERVRASMLVGEMMGVSSLEHDSRDRVSLSQVIGRLIAFRDRHAERARRSKQRRRLRSAETEGGNGPGGQAGAAADKDGST